jgi:hypothetical protein
MNKGDIVVVTKGRKVPLGTRGRVTFNVPGKYGRIVGIRTRSGDEYRTSERNLEVIQAIGRGDAPFRDPGGKSALRAGDRKFPCPTCQRRYQLTMHDVLRGYQCDRCAEELERGY